MGSVVVVVILPLLELVGEEAGIVDDLALEEAVELLGIVWWDRFTFPFNRGVRGRILTWSMPLSSSCQWNEAPNSAPLSVCTRSTANGSFDSTESMNWIAVFWSQRG